MSGRNWILPTLLLVELIVFTLIGGPSFQSAGEVAAYFQSYAADLIPQSAPVLLLAFGMTLVLATGGIDLSVGSAVALICCAMASCPTGVPFWYTALPVGLLLGTLLGLVNGALIATASVPPIIATLGSMMLYRGLCFVVMGDLEKSPFLDVPGYEGLGSFSGATVLVGVVFLVGGGFFHRSRWRRELLMLGGNSVAARYAGIPLTRRLIELYTLLGGLAFLAALTFSARNGSVSASSLTGLELKVIVAVVLGGTRVQGGNCCLAGTFMGVLIIAVLDEGLRSSVQWGDRHLPFKISHLHYLLLGLLLVVGVWVNSQPRRPPGRTSPRKSPAIDR